MRTMVQRFAELMDKKLSIRDEKYPEGWKNCGPNLLEHLDEEVKEFHEAAIHWPYDYDKVLGEAVDVANMVMLFVDALGCLNTKEEREIYFQEYMDKVKKNIARDRVSDFQIGLPWSVKK